MSVANLLARMLSLLGLTAISYLATAFPMTLGRALWPDGLGAGMENVFWPATAWHFAILTARGAGLWPTVFVGTLCAQLTLGRPLDSGLVNAAGNVAEALLFTWAWTRRSGQAHAHGPRDLRGAVVFLVAAAACPLASALPGACTLVFNGWIHREDWASAVVVWQFANASSVVLLTPLFWRLLSGRATAPAAEPVLVNGESASWFALCVVCYAFAFEAVFRGDVVNFAFLAYPFVVYAAVRLGGTATALSLAMIMPAIYFALIRARPSPDPGDAYATLWFVQLFCFALGATGLLLAALTEERANETRRAEAESGRALQASLSAARARLAALRYQLNPHFLFNSLNSIQATIPLSAEAPRKMVSELADYLRDTLHDPEVEQIPLKRELDMVRRYLSVERARFGDALEVELGADAGCANAQVPVFFLQPLVENAIRHGFERSRQTFRLQVRARVEDNRVRITVANTGVWRPPSARPGLGLANVRRRLELLHGTSAWLEVDCRDGWVRVEAALPLVFPDPAKP